MLNGSKWPLNAIHPSLVAIMGSFAPNGAGAVDNTSNQGTGFTVARTGVGVFEITFADKTGDLVAALSGLQLNALADTDILFGAYTKATKKLVVNVKTAGVAADIAANANNRISFGCIFKTSDIKK